MNVYDQVQNKNEGARLDNTDSSFAFKCLEGYFPKMLTLYNKVPT